MVFHLFDSLNSIGLNHTKIAKLISVKREIIAQLANEKTQSIQVGEHTIEIPPTSHHTLPLFCALFDQVKQIQLEIEYKTLTDSKNEQDEAKENAAKTIVNFFNDIVSTDKTKFSELIFSNICTYKNFVEQILNKQEDLSDDKTTHVNNKDKSVVSYFNKTTHVNNKDKNVVSYLHILSEFDYLLENAIRNEWSKNNNASDTPNIYVMIKGNPIEITENILHKIYMFRQYVSEIKLFYSGTEVSDEINISKNSDHCIKMFSEQKTNFTMFIKTESCALSHVTVYVQNHFIYDIFSHDNLTYAKYSRVTKSLSKYASKFEALSLPKSEFQKVDKFKYECNETLFDLNTNHLTFSNGLNPLCLTESGYIEALKSCENINNTDELLNEFRILRNSFIDFLKKDGTYKEVIYNDNYYSYIDRTTPQMQISSFLGLSPDIVTRLFPFVCTKNQTVSLEISKLILQGYLSILKIYPNFKTRFRPENQDGILENIKRIEIKDNSIIFNDNNSEKFMILNNIMLNSIKNKTLHHWVDKLNYQHMQDELCQDSIHKISLIISDIENSIQGINIKLHQKKPKSTPQKSNIAESPQEFESLQLKSYNINSDSFSVLTNKELNQRIFNRALFLTVPQTIYIHLYYDYVNAEICKMLLMSISHSFLEHDYDIKIIINIPENIDSNQNEQLQKTLQCLMPLILNNKVHTYIKKSDFNDDEFIRRCVVLIPDKDLFIFDNENDIESVSVIKASKSCDLINQAINNLELIIKDTPECIRKSCDSRNIFANELRYYETKTDNIRIMTDGYSPYILNSEEYSKIYPKASESDLLLIQTKNNALNSFLEDSNSLKVLLTNVKNDQGIYHSYKGNLDYIAVNENTKQKLDEKSDYLSKTFPSFKVKIASPITENEPSPFSTKLFKGCLTIYGSKELSIRYYDNSSQGTSDNSIIVKAAFDYFNNCFDKQ